MEFNLSKCKVMEFGKSKKRIQYHYEVDGVKLHKSKEEVDLGVTVTENLTPDRHINKITGERINLLKRIKMAFSYLDEGMIKKKISVFHDKTKIGICDRRNIIKLERVQRTVT